MLDIAKFDKILINLISNALKFTPSGGEVAVSLRLRDGAMVFAVADNGIGIDIADHDRIFRRFEQIEGGSTRRYGGTGLGLSLVKVFAELMGGSVSVESALGKGATFTVRIPRMLADESINDAARDVVSYQRRAFTPEAIGHDTPAQAPARGSPHVVVAEDNRDLRRYLTDLLSAEFRVTALEDGQSAYDVIRKEHPDVVVSDVMMPLMDGFELIAKLKSDPGLATIPVLLLTARAGAEMAADSIDRGADDYLTKPFSPLDLLARVRAAHRIRQLYTSLIEAEHRASEAERREALQKMRAESEAKIRRLVDANIIGVFIWDFEGRIVEANDAFLRMVDYDREDLVSGRIRWTELTPPEWLDRDERRWVPELKVTGSLQPFEKEYFRKDGSRVPMLIGAATFEEDGNQGVAFVLDLTERKRAEEALRQLESDLAHMNRLNMMGELAASLAHEITQPIATTRNNARVAMRFLDRNPPDLGEVREALACIVGDADRAGEIIGRIRDQIRKAPPRKARFDLTDAIDEVIVLGRSAITKNGVLVQTRLAEGLFPVRGDRVQLQQVILNLVLNAVEAMSAVEAGPRELLISTEQTEANGVLVAVRDSGPGIDPEHVERVFEAFYTTKTSGVGMGLSICRSIIGAHGGRLWADSNEPRGAVFQFTLPGVES